MLFIVFYEVTYIFDLRLTPWCPVGAKYVVEPYLRFLGPWNRVSIGINLIPVIMEIAFAGDKSKIHRADVYFRNIG